MKGFLGTQAGFGADLILLLEVVMGISLVTGVFFARAKRYTLHGICQSTVLLLNLMVIAASMWPSFSSLVLPRLPRRFTRPYYGVATVHAVLGSAAELLGLYIVLVAGTNLLPASWSFSRWKLWMRIEFALWMLVLLLGMATYLIWYVAIP